MFAASKSGRAGSAAPTTDASFGYVPLLLETGSASSLNTTVTDSSASPNTVTRVSNPSTGWVSPYQTDGYWGNLFSSASDGLTFAASAGFVLTGGAFTIEFWAYPTVGSNYDTIIDGGMLSGFGLTRRAGTNAIVWQAGGAQLEVGTTFLLNQWSHIVANYTGTGSVNLYINGASVSSAASIPTNSGTTALYVGKYSAGQPFTGYISNVRIVKGSAVYTNGSTITVPTAPLTPVTNTQLLTCYSNRFIDANTATTAKTITVTGTPQVNPYFYPSGFTAPAASPGAGLFAAASSQTLITTQTQVIPTGNFTIEVWAYVTSSTATQTFLSQGTSGSAGRTAIGIDNSSGAKWFCQVGGVFVYSSAAPVLNTWNYLAMTYNGTQIALYLNGTSLGSQLNVVNAQNSQLRVGGLWTPATAGYYLDGYLANIRVSNTVRTVTSVPTTFLTSDANTTLLLNLADSNYNSATDGVQNNTFIDSSNYAFPVTRNGTPTQGSITPYWPNGQWSNYFAGSQSISAPASSSFQFAGDFTIECWVFRTTTGDQTTYIQTNSTTYFALNVNAGTGLNIYLNSATASIAATDRVPALNVWNHVALVRSGSGSGNVKVYLNGVASATTATNTATLGYNLVAYVGSIGTQSSGSNVGYISNVRVVAAAVYTSNFTPPTTPLGAISGGQNPPTGTQTKLLTCQSNRFLDNSPAPFTITPNGTPQVQAFQPFSPTASYTTALYGGSGYFGGSPSYLSFPSNSAMNFGTGDFTVEAWVYPTATPGDGAGPIGGATSNILFAYSASAFPGKWAFGRNNVAFDFSSLTDIVLNTWTHLAVSRSSGTIRFFINGALTNSASNSNSYILTGGGNIGFNGASSYFTGYMSQIRAVGTAVYTGAFTPPTLAPISTTGPTSAASYSSTTNVNTTFLTPASLLLNMTNAGIYDAAVQNDLITAGNAQVSIAQAQFPPSSILFDGTGDYLEPVTTPALTLGTSNFTIEGWVYFNSVASFQIMYDQRPPSTNGAYPCLFMNGAIMTWFVNGAIQITSGTLSAGVWYYFAVTRSSSVTKMFINGSQVGSNYSDTNNYLASRTIIGISSYDFLLGINGYLEDFRITKGVGRTITASPTAPFPTR